MSSATLTPGAAPAFSPAPKRASDDIPFNPKVRQHKSPGDWVVDIVIVAILVLVVVAVIYPLWFVVIASVSDQTLVSNGQVTVVPRGFSLGGYAKVFADTRIWTGYRNTILYSLVGTLVNMVVTIPVAFGLSRREFKARRVILFLFTFRAR